MRRLAAALLAAALALGLWGCTEGEAEPSLSLPPEPTASQQAQAQAFALAYDPQASLHPISGQSQVNLDLAGLVYEGLYELDQAFQPQPALARSASVSGDGLVWTITLRADARFSDGTPLTAAHVVSSLNAARDSALYGARLSAVASVAESEGTVVITLSAPNGALPALLDIPIVLEQEGGIPLGTGRYRFVQGQDGLSLLANEDYGQALPCDSIELIPVTGADERIAAFDSGEVTAAVTDFTSSYALGYSGSYETCDFPTSTLLYVGFRTASGVCASAQVRQAFSKAFDREGLVSAVLASHGDAASLPISPLHQEYDQQAAGSLDYDVQGGRELLLAAGYAEGEDGLLYRGSAPLSVTIVVNNDSTPKQRTAQFLAECLKAVGVTATVNQLPWEEYLGALSAGQFDLYIGEVRMTGDFDPAALLTGALNYGGFASQTVPALLTAWQGARGEARIQAAAQLWQAFAQEAPIAPLCFKRGSLLIRWGMAANVQPTQADPWWNMEQWELAE
mgnify:CR=1 FL=1